MREAALKVQMAKKLAVLQQVEAYRQGNKIEFFTKPKPEGIPANPPQEELLKAWVDRQYKVLTYTGANRCLGGEQLIYDPVAGVHYRADSLPNAFNVHSWDGEKLVVAGAISPFTKGFDRLYRVSFSNGGRLVCTLGHRILTPTGFSPISELRVGSTVCTPCWVGCESQTFFGISQRFWGQHGAEAQRLLRGTRSLLDKMPGRLLQGLRSLVSGNRWRSIFGGLLLSLSCHRVSTLGAAPLIHAEGGLNFFETGQGCQFGCRFLCGFCGVLFPLAAKTCRCAFPSQGDVHGHIRACLRLGALGRIPEYIRSCLSSGHPSIQRVQTLFYIFVSFVERLNPRPGKSDQKRAGGRLFFCKTRTSSYRNLENLEFVSPTDIQPSSKTSTITAIEYIRDDWFYDFTVPVYHNYQDVSAVINANTGKTTIGAIIAINTAAGKWLWSGEKIFFPHNKPRKIRYIGQDWEKHIKAVVIPALREWWPANRPVSVKKNSLGVEAFWVDETTGSTIEVMSNNQEPDLHEGWHGDLIVYDEPPRREIRVANARGLIDRLGRELFCMTLLKEAWVDREVIKARNADGSPDTSVYNIHADIYANIGYGVTEEGVEQFKKTLTADEISARIDGKPAYMSGLVAKNFDRKLHLKKRFEVPLDWVVDIAIDIHPRKEQAVLFVATSDRNFRYAVDEIWDHGDGTWVAEQIIRRIKRAGYRVGSIICDPLAKGDANNENTTFDKIDKVLAQHGYYLRVASKDKQSGIIELNNHLLGPNQEPSLFFFNDLVRTIYEIEGWQYDKETQKPAKVSDDMMENLYRILLLDTKYEPPGEEEQEEETTSTANPHTGY